MGSQDEPEAPNSSAVRGRHYPPEAYIVKLQPGTKAPAAKGWPDTSKLGPLPPEGEWWGFLTGSKSGYAVLDLDSYKGGHGELEVESLPRTLTVATPSGGRHLYYTVPKGEPCPAYGGPNYEFQGDRRQVVGAGSPGYRVVLDVPPAPLPDALRQGRPGGSLPHDGELRAPNPKWDTLLRSVGCVPVPGGYDHPVSNNRGISVTVWNDRLKVHSDSFALEFGLSREGTHSLDWVADVFKRREAIEAGEVSTLWVAARGRPLPPETVWLWPPYVPAGRLTLLEGREGIGKGLMCAYLAVQEAQKGSNVLWVSVEDDLDLDILRRLAAAGYRPETPGEILFPSRPWEVFFEENPVQLREAIDAHNPSLLILDPGRDVLKSEGGQSGKNNDESVLRPGLLGLAHLAAKSGVAVVFVHHQNKYGTDARSRSTGSVAFRQVARHVLTLDRYLKAGAWAVDKSNVSEVGHVHEYTTEYVPEWGAPRFVPGERRPDIESIDVWKEKAASGELATVAPRGEEGQRECLYCGTMYTPERNDPRSRYCSPEHRKAAENRRRRGRES